MLNKFYGLPLDPRWKLHTWASIFEHSDSLFYSYHIENVDPQQESLLWAYFFAAGRRDWSRSFTSLLVQCFRFNLRPLASFRVFASLLLLLMVSLCYAGQLSRTMLAGSSLPLMYLIYQGSFAFTTTNW